MTVPSHVLMHYRPQKGYLFHLLPLHSFKLTSDSLFEVLSSNMELSEAINCAVGSFTIIVAVRKELFMCLVVVVVVINNNFVQSALDQNKLPLGLDHLINIANVTTIKWLLFHNIKMSPYMSKMSPPYQRFQIVDGPIVIESTQYSVCQWETLAVFPSTLTKCVRSLNIILIFSAKDSWIINILT